MRRAGGSRLVSFVLLAVLALVGWWLWPSSLGGQSSYVTTHGISMEPRFHTGDLAVIRPASAYRVGDVAAYRSDLLHTVVMHRIVAVHDGRYTFKGDNNTWLDPQPPRRDHLIGTLALRIPHGGQWLSKASTPLPLAFLSLLLLSSGGAGLQTRRSRRRRATVARHAAPRPASTGPWMAMPPATRSTGAAAGATAVLALLIGSAAWTGPVTHQVTTTGKIDRSMTFSYTAQAPRSVAYDATTVTAPDPVFRKLVHSLDVHYRYHGAPGSISVTAQLSAPSGWHTTLPLTGPTPFTTRAESGTVRLDLDALDARARAAATATGIPTSQLDIPVVPAVTANSGAVFSPRLQLVSTPLQLSLAAPSASLVVSDASTSIAHHLAPRMLGLARYRIPLATARLISVGLLALSLLLGGLVLALATRFTPATEAARIRRRFASLLVAVAPPRAALEPQQHRHLRRPRRRHHLPLPHQHRARGRGKGRRPRRCCGHPGSRAHISLTTADRPDADRKVSDAIHLRHLGGLRVDGSRLGSAS